MSDEVLEQYLIDHFKVWVNAGSMYGSAGYLRINLATSRQLLSTGLNRLIQGLKSIS